MDEFEKETLRQIKIEKEIRMLQICFLLMTIFTVAYLIVKDL